MNRKPKTPSRLQQICDLYGLAPKDRITVCAACLTAACWQGEFYCERYRQADTTTKTVRELAALAREHPHYWAR